jgi:hypothetical protein
LENEPADPRGVLSRWGRSDIPIESPGTHAAHRRRIIDRIAAAMERELAARNRHRLGGKLAGFTIGALFGAAVGLSRGHWTWSPSSVPLRLYAVSGVAHAALLQDFHIARFRALQSIGDHGAAAREAQRYLALYPDGFAQDEARRLTVAPPQ